MKKKKQLSFAERAKKIQKTFDGREDTISKATMMHQLKGLKAEQEAARVLIQNAEAKRNRTPRMDGSGEGMRQGMTNNQMAYGGYIPPEQDDDLQNDARSIVNARIDDSSIDQLDSIGIQMPQQDFDLSQYMPNAQKAVNKDRRAFNKDLRQADYIDNPDGYSGKDGINWNKMSDERFTSLPMRMAPMFANAKAKMQAKRPDVASPDYLDSSLYNTRERYAEENAKSKVRNRSSRYRSKMSDRSGGDYNAFVRGLAAIDSSENRELSNIGDNAAQYNVQQRALEMQRKGGVDQYNNQLSNRYNENVSDANNALTQYKRDLDAQGAVNWQGMGKEMFNSQTSDRFVDATKETMMAQAVNAGIDVNTAEWQAYMKSTQKDNKPNKARTRKSK